MEWLNRLVVSICDLGAPISLPAPNEILCADLEQLRGLAPRQRMVRLRAAKREALRQYLADCVDQIAEASGSDDGQAATLLGGFIADDFVGRDDDRTTPRSHATLALHFYGAPLPDKDIRRWTRMAVAAARPPRAAECSPAGPVVYFISIGDAATVKIGYSANLKHRLRALRTASPVEPHVHLVMGGDKRLEAEFRERFRTDHIRREWFWLSKEIADFIAANRRG